MADTPVYRTLTELVHAWAELCDKNEQASPEGVRVSDLVRTYFEAQNNPPTGIIGVGAISYAEEIILAKQGVVERNDVLLLPDGELAQVIMLDSGGGQDAPALVGRKVLTTVIGKGSDSAVIED